MRYENDNQRMRMLSKHFMGRLWRYNWNFTNNMVWAHSVCACQTVAVPIVILHERWVVNHGNCGRPARDLRVRLVQPENDGSFRETPRNTIPQDDPDPTHEYSNPMMFSLAPTDHCGFQVSPSPGKPAFIQQHRQPWKQPTLIGH